jgi:hypothetical protein
LFIKIITFNYKNTVFIPKKYSLCPITLFWPFGKIAYSLTKGGEEGWMGDAVLDE